MKDDLSRDVSELQKDIVKYFGSERKVSSLMQTVEKKEDQLIIVKEVISNANKQKHSDGKTNNWYIYRLSNLNAKRVMLENLLSKATSKSEISKSQIKADLDKVLSEIRKIKSSMIVFNRDTKVKIDLDESLNLLNE